MTPRQAIKQKCNECCAGSITEVKECNITRCPLWQFREQEKNKPKKELSQKQLKQLEQMRQKRKNGSSTQEI